MADRCKWEGPSARPAGPEHHPGQPGGSNGYAPFAPVGLDDVSEPFAARPQGEGGGRDWCETFAETVQEEIVPRLLALTGSRSQKRVPVPADLVTAVADAAVEGEVGVVESHIFSHVMNGASVGDALLDIVGPAARSLGIAWERDERDFMEVTIGLGTLQQVLAALSDDRVDPAMPNRRILLGPTPGEGHTLGLAIIDHLFRSARWDVVFDPYADRHSLVDHVQDSWFAVVGLTLAADTFIDEAATTIQSMRSASLNPRLRVLVGGPAFGRWEGLGERIGADAVATDGRDAVDIANLWVADSAEEAAR